MSDLLSLCLVALLVAPAAAVDWHLCGPGGGGWIQSVAYSPHDPDVLYVGCDVGGFYRSDDRGQTWTIHNRGLRDFWVEQIVSHPTDPDVLWVGTLSGLHRSDDGGRTWRLCRDGFPPTERYRYSAPIACLVVDPASPDTLYAGIGNPRNRKDGHGAIYRSDDGGRTWRLITPPGALPADAIVISLLLRPNGGLLISTQHGLFESRDGGATWQPRNEGLGRAATRYLAASPAAPNVLYCTVDATPGQEPWDGGVYRSDDGGASWTLCIEGLPTRVRAGSGERNLTCQYDHLVVDPRDPDTVYVGGDAWVNATVYKSTDGGRHWSDAIRRPRDGQPGNIDLGYITFWGPTPKCLAIHPTDPGRLFFGTSGMVYETRDAGASWAQLYTHDLGGGAWTGAGLEVTCLWSLVPHPARPGSWFLGYMDIGLWQTFDEGRSLTRCMAGVAPEHGNAGMAFAFDPDDPDHVWGGFGQWHSNRGGLYESRDGGRNWSRILGPPEGQPRDILVDAASPPDNRRLWVCVREHGVLEGRLGDGAWRSLNDGLPHEDVVHLALRGGDRPALVALLQCTREEPGGVWERPLDAERWSRLDGEPFVADAKAIAIAPTDSQRVYVACRERRIAGKTWPGGAFASQDGGRTWSRIYDDHFINALAVSPVDPDVVVIGGTDHPFHDEPLGCGVHLSRDGGRSWTDITGDVTMPNVSVLVFDPHDPERLIVGTAGNSFAWRRLP